MINILSEHVVSLVLYITQFHNIFFFMVLGVFVIFKAWIAYIIRLINIWNYTSIVTVPDSWVYPQIVTVPACPTVDKDAPEETLDTRTGPFDRDTGAIEQLMYPVQPQFS